MAWPSPEVRRISSVDRSLFLGAGVVLVALFCFAFHRPLSAQSVTPAEPYDPLQLYVGTWVARARSGEKQIDCITLKLTESDGKLAGSLSHFGLSLFVDGQNLPSPCAPGQDEIKNLHFDDGLGDFEIGDNLLEVRLIPEGTDIIHLTFLAPTVGAQADIRAQEQARVDDEIKFMNEWHASSFSPDAFLVRSRVGVAGAAFPNGAAVGSSAATDETLWPVQYALVMINTSEARYRFMHGNYAGYSELAASGLLENTASSAFKGSLGLDLGSTVTPKKGWKTSIDLAPDRLSYVASIQLEPQRKCEVRFSSPETGMISEERFPGCFQN